MNSTPEHHLRTIAVSLRCDDGRHLNFSLGLCSCGEPSEIVLVARAVADEIMKFLLPSTAMPALPARMVN